MTCDHCSNKATIFLTKVEGDQLKKIAICQECAENPALVAKEGLEQLLGIPALPIVPQPTSSVTLSCRCGYSLEDLTRIGRLGCPECYHTFQSFIEDRISSIHRGIQHTGKKIHVELTDEMLERKQKQLLEELNSAIENEEFEKAASLRDEIESIKHQLAC